jgi:hypothetical protein
MKKDEDNLDVLRAIVKKNNFASKNLFDKLEFFYL